MIASALTEGACKLSYMQKLKDRIVEARLEAGLDPAEMARRAGVQPAAAYQWESGATKSLKASTAVALARALGVRVEWLTQGVGPKKHQNGIAEPISHYDATAQHNVFGKQYRVSIRGAVAMDDQGFWQDGDLEADSFPVITEDASAYAIRLLTQRFQPVADLGACLLVSPSSPLKEGRQVVVTLHDGRMTFRTYRGHSYGIWRFVDVNDANAYLDLADGSVSKVERVMSVFWTD